MRVEGNSFFGVVMRLFGKCKHYEEPRPGFHLPEHVVRFVLWSRAQLTTVKMTSDLVEE